MRIPKHCDRCGTDLWVSTMSRFNLDMICMDCQRKERRNPRYPQAAAAELAACRRGDYNFPGIGKPEDL